MEKKQARHLHPVCISTWLLALSACILLATTDMGASATSASAAQPAERLAAIPMSSDTMVLVDSNDAKAQLPSNKGQITAPAVGERIAFAIQEGQMGNPVVDIYTMDANGSNITQLTSHPDLDYSPSWSPDGTQIAFVRGPWLGTTQIYIMDANGNNPHPITSGSGANLVHIDPAWSPDGTQIAFASTRDGTHYEIYVIDLVSRNVSRLTNDQTASTYPRWSPDGNRIAFVNTRRDGDNYNEIYVMDANGNNQQRITDPNPGSSDDNPVWSPDGNKIAFARDRQIYTMNANGSGIMPVTQGGNFVNLNPTWSPDSQRIAFSRHDLNSQIHVVDANGANMQQITNVPQIPGAFQPDWQRRGTPVVLVQDENGQPVQGAMVYWNRFIVDFCGFVGTTNISGTLTLPLTPSVDDLLIARSLVITGTTQKGAHDGWAYHVWHTNITQREDGFESAYVVTNTNLLTHTLTVLPTQAQIGFNIVASVEYNATDANLSTIAAGLGGQGDGLLGYTVGATDFLRDVTDGQMFFEKVTIYEDKQNWDNADYQFFAHYPRADADATDDGRSAITGTCCHIRVNGFGHYGIPWNQLDGFSTLIHEFGHYGLGASDEYYHLEDGDTSTCNVTPDPDYYKAASIMSDQGVSSEFCTHTNHNPQTNHHVIHGQSVWDTVRRNWTDTQGRWAIQRPADRGVFVLPGPHSPLCWPAQGGTPEIVSVPTASCAPILVTVTLLGSPVISASLSLDHNGGSISQGVTDSQGRGAIVGAVLNQDTIRVRASGFLGLQYTGSATVTSCNSITIPLTPFLAGPNADRPNGQWPLYTLTATPDFSQNQVHAVLDFTADPPSQPALYASQGGINRQQITLVYDPVGHNYTGDYPFDPSRALDFQFDVGLEGAQGVELFPYRFKAAQFHTSGPFANSPTVPTNWNLFPPETSVNLSVDPNSLPDGTGVMGGHVNIPAEPPDGLLAVGGPYTIEGQNPISGSVHLSLEFQSEYFCGLQSGSTSIYRFNGTSWDALPTSLNEEWHLAATPITQWGIYAVFARPNPRLAFTDVPPGSTFYEYINWITCHTIASGYPDGTFRPNASATRGQISKMVALAYQWRLDPPEGQRHAQGNSSQTGGAHTFADVLPDSTFFLYVEAAYREGVVSGYPCGGVGEPCDPQQRPYFRPNNNVTRGQLSKIVAGASRWSETPVGQTFEDIAPGSTFYGYIERMAARGIIGGYACGGANEPCVPPGNRPYFRPGNNATRGQLSKMIYLALQPR